MIIFKPHESFSYIKQYIPEKPVIVEAGAFDGHETLRMLSVWPEAIIHAFEPIPAIFKKLEVTTEHLAHVHRYQMALSDTTGKAEIYVSEKPDRPEFPTQASSLRAPKERLHHSSIQFPYTLEVPTITLDDWAQQHRIPQVDLLWLDMQGFELDVLKAAPKLLESVSAIYTEVSFIESYAGQAQYPEVKAWLESIGFVIIGRDFPDDTTKFFGNALFVRRSSL
jgi:FkbM family methyltransferase